MVVQTSARVHPAAEVFARSAEEGKDNAYVPGRSSTNPIRTNDDQQAGALRHDDERERDDIATICCTRSSSATDIQERMSALTRCDEDYARGSEGLAATSENSRRTARVLV